MIYIKAGIPKELNKIDDELKVINHSKDIICFFILKKRKQQSPFIEKTK